ncbi:MAG: arginine decarboxylase [Deltaproteobacteria bacterium]|nr:MAG: arginine decarboxylase [Deltaproteobacteria bacterium]
MKTLERWTIEKSGDLYGVENWGNGYFSINKNGELVITALEDKNISISVPEIIEGIKERGFDMPVLLRIQNILESQLFFLHKSFGKAMDELGYKGCYRGVYPIKVNQQKQVLKEVTKFGVKNHHGLEAGSKAELIAAMAYMKSREACLICNGYKDEEFIDLALYAKKMGLKCFIVIEMPGELDIVIKRSRQLGIKPLLGIRIKLSSKASGHWTESGGDRSIFGLDISQVISAIDQLKKENMLDSMQLLHYHLGSQIPNIRDIRDSVLEACRIYSGLKDEGAAMEFLDLGGGLAVDYDGSHTNFQNSRNYSVEEYCADIIESVMSEMDKKGIEHPVIITESGRASVAYYSVLIFNILDTTTFDPKPFLDEFDEDKPEVIENLIEVLNSITIKNIQECFNDAIYYRDELRLKFKHGDLNLRERAAGETIFWHILSTIAVVSKQLKHVPKELQDIDSALADIYYGNFSVFQSIPDSWAIHHLFPIMPLQQLDKEPLRHTTLADITCDCDGKIDKFIDIHGIKKSILLHEIDPAKPYYLGVFLVGAYQETLGDLHNLFGDTNVVSIRINEDGTYDFIKEIEGDSVQNVLSAVGYSPGSLLGKLRDSAEKAVKEGKISVKDRYNIVKAYETGLRGYTYYED